MADLIPSDGILVKNARLAVKLALHEKRALGQPIARFDPKTKTVYLENADGSTTPMSHVMEQAKLRERHE